MYPSHYARCSKFSPAIPADRGGGEGGKGFSVLTHLLVQFDWRQHFSPRGHISSNQQPVIDAHPGMGFGTGHVPGLLPENQSTHKTVIYPKLMSASDQRLM